MSKKYPYPEEVYMIDEMAKTVRLNGRHSISPKFDIDNGHEPHCIEAIKRKTPYYDCVDEMYPGYTTIKATVFLDKIPTEALVQELANREGVSVRMYRDGTIYALEFPG